METVGDAFIQICVLESKKSVVRQEEMLALEVGVPCSLVYLIPKGTVHPASR